MGILDEAIRDHLELKRQRGAAREELKRLEDEAFGPPSRPGEPDFPQAEAGGSEPDQTVAEAEAPTTVVGADEMPSLPETPPEAQPEAARNGGAEPPAEEHAVLSEEAASPATPFDHTLDDDLDIADLDLELDEPAVAPEAPATEEPAPPPAEETPESAAPPPEQTEPPIESLETVEHPLEPGLTEDEVESDELSLDEPSSEELPLEPPSEEASHEPPSEETGEEPPAGDATATPEAEPESTEDDVLADTPDFLRDAPEDDELWFEQGEPKDFDFD